MSFIPDKRLSLSSLKCSLKNHFKERTVKYHRLRTNIKVIELFPELHRQAVFSCVAPNKQ